MEKKQKKEYLAPMTDSVEFKSEKILCASGDGVNPSNPFSGFNEFPW